LRRQNGRTWGNLGEVTRLVKKLPGGKALGVNEMHPAMLKAMDMTVLADMPLQCHMEVWDNTCVVADRGGGPHF